MNKEQIESLLIDLGYECLGKVYRKISPQNNYLIYIEIREFCLNMFAFADSLANIRIESAILFEYCSRGHISDVESEIVKILSK